ncbi:reverse transcriptase (RNA-dependent DNA polymerase) [Azospirillum brasilense]|nr:reverse transcriptase (RNA-dependent DNA polymerase) [Azospirillum brasilense]
MGGMRSQYWIDLHDHYDFHRNRGAVLLSLRQRILDGQYRPEPPMSIRLEKANGICRRLSVPSAEDAVVLQTIVECISPSIIKKAPSKNAYYSRSHKNKKPRIDIEADYIWFVQYKKFANRLQEFASTSNFLLVTDVANYFDNIELSSLRNSISSMGEIKEVIMDILFNILDEFRWRSDYLPAPGRGLPQVDFDAPRLLGHAFLFELDKEIAKCTDDNFVRWMDDIDIPADSEESCKHLLCRLDEILNARGLRLNGSKTKILNAELAKQYLFSDENKNLDLIEEAIKETKADNQNVPNEALQARFDKFFCESRSGRWDKVLKRYIGLFSKTNDNYIESFLPDLLSNFPAVRDNIFSYYSSLGYSDNRLKQIVNYLTSEHCIDDVSMFSAVRVLIGWKLDWESEGADRIRWLANEMEKERRHNLVGPIWINAKYSAPGELRNFINHNKNRWLSTHYLARQVAATLPRLRLLPDFCQQVERWISERGLNDAASVIKNLDDIRTREKFEKPEMSYFKHGEVANKAFPLHKFLICMDVLQSGKFNYDEKQKLKLYLLNNVQDPIYKRYFSMT